MKKAFMKRAYRITKGKNEVMVLEEKENIIPRKGPGIKMEPENHMQTASWGKSKEEDKMSKGIYFFMTKEDLLNLSDELENKMNIVFYDNSNITSADGRCLDTLRKLPSLGINKSGSHHTESFLVLPIEKDVVIEAVPQKNGETHYFIDQSRNVDSIVFWPGGFYDDSKLICGEVGTISDTTISKSLYNCFCKIIKKICKERAGCFWYSENVKKLENVRLITININEMPIYDVKLHKEE